MSTDKIAATSTGVVVAMHDRMIIREVRGSMFSRIDWRFAIILILSILFHGTIIYVVNSIKLKPVEMIEIEKMPERFAKLIIEKPIPKDIKQQRKIETLTTENVSTESEMERELKEAKTPKKKKEIQQKVAKKAVARRAARVEKKIRTVGVLGMLTGVGATAKGPSIVDVLGKTNRKKERFQDLEKALENMTGLQQAKSVDIVSKKLVRSKDVKINHRESIDNLVASIGTAHTTALSKRGNFVIQRPESIEGSASSNAKRDNAAVNKVVSKNKTSIRMSYEKHLKRTPDLAGKITVRFTISASGRVSSVLILENTTGNKGLEKDIVRKVKMWRFEQIVDGEVTVTYPFVFRPS